MIRMDPRFGEKKHQSGAAQRAYYKNLFAAFEVPCVEQRLEFGDFAFTGHGPDESPFSIGVELKTVPDLVQSMQTGRLAGHQLPGLVETYQRVYLVIEGLSRCSRKTGALEVPRGLGYRPLTAGRPVFWSDVERFLMDVEEASVRVKRTRSPYETAALLARVLVPWWEKQYAEHKGLHVLYAPPAAGAILRREDPDRLRFRKVLHSLGCSIGWDRSNAVADHFASIRDAIEADADTWAAIPGIGTRIAGEVIRVVNARVPNRGIQARRLKDAPRPQPPGTRQGQRSGTADAQARARTARRR